MSCLGLGVCVSCIWIGAFIATYKASLCGPGTLRQSSFARGENARAGQTIAIDPALSVSHIGPYATILPARPPYVLLEM
jgi:hypothetical protein